MLWKILSGAARHVGTRENAEMCARRVLALKPDDPEAWSNLSRIVRDAHRRSDAERLLRSGLEHTDYAPRLAQPLFEVLDEDNRFEEALDAINEIIGKQKEPSAILFRVKGEIHERLDDLDNARLAYEEASRLAPMDGETTAAVAAFLDKLVDPEPLLAHLRAARERGVTFDRGDLLDGEAVPSCAQANWITPDGAFSSRSPNRANCLKCGADTLRWAVSKTRPRTIGPRSTPF